MKKERWERLSNGTVSLYKGTIAWLFFMIIAALLVLAAVSTCFLDDFEMPYLLPDHVGLNLLASAASLLLIFGFHRAKNSLPQCVKEFFARVETEDVLFLKIRKWILCSFWILLSIWAVSTQVQPTADRFNTLQAAEEIAKGEYTMGGPIGYIFVYSNLLGWTMVEVLLNRVFGEYNHVAYQLLNAPCIALICLYLSELGGQFGLNRKLQLVTILLCIAFTPLALHVSFVYGTIPGLMLALLAVKLEIDFFRGGTWKQALGSSLCIALATLMKTNYLIFMVAMVIYAMVEMIRVGSIRRSYVIVLILVLCFAQGKLAKSSFEHMTGMEIPRGSSAWSWIGMGLQDGRRPGWWNNYNYITFEESNFDPDVQNAWVKGELRDRLGEFWQDKDYARSFFVAKTATQWNEPTFQSVWISITTMQAESEQDVIGVNNDWPKILLSPAGNDALTRYLNVLNYLILFGVFLYLLLGAGSKAFYESLILPMVFVGGFVFHLVWEAKGLYAFPYFVLLLPYAVLGFSYVPAGVDGIGTIRKTGRLPFTKKQIICNLLVLGASLLILWYVFHGTLPRVTGDTAEYLAYLDRKAVELPR